MTRIRDLIWRAIAVAVLAGVIAVGVMVYRDLTRDGDGAGNAFRGALTEAARRGDLERPVAVSALAPFGWDAVAVVYPYAERFAREDVGDDADELPSLHEDEVAIIFISDAHLAGWTVLGPDFFQRAGLDGPACLVLDRPAARERAYLLARRGRLRFSSATRALLSGGSSACR